MTSAAQTAASQRESTQVEFEWKWAAGFELDPGFARSSGLSRGRPRLSRPPGLKAL